jgi:hypothetical protein
MMNTISPYYEFLGLMVTIQQIENPFSDSNLAGCKKP